MKIQRYDTTEGEIRAGIWVKEKDHEAKMQQSMRIIKELRKEIYRYKKHDLVNKTVQLIEDCESDE